MPNPKDLKYLAVALAASLSLITVSAVALRYTGLIHIKGPAGTEVVIDGREVKPPSR